MSDVHKKQETSVVSLLVAAYAKPGCTMLLYQDAMGKAQV